MVGKIKLNHLMLIILTIILVLVVGCNGSVTPDTPSPSEEDNEEPVGPTAGSIIIAGGAESTNDCTPTLTISSEGASYMSFSGDGATWTDWIDYAASYDKFYIANNLYGTKLSSGTKSVYVRFKDNEENLSPQEELASDSIYYNMPVLKYLVIDPPTATMKVNGKQLFTVSGIDKNFVEVPLDGTKVTWSHCCNVGEVNPKTGLSTTYTAPSTSGPRNVSASYNNLKRTASITVSY